MENVGWDARHVRQKMFCSPRGRMVECCRLRFLIGIGAITIVVLFIVHGRSDVIEQYVRSTEVEVLPMIYAITPTYRRATQMPELTRLSHTLMHVPRLHWVLVEDAQQCSPQVAELLKRTGLPYTHLLGPRPPNRLKKQYGRGVSNRRKALVWLRNHVTEGVLYFADDDNTYDTQLFEEMRYTKKVSVWPVGLIGKYATISAPVVKNGKVVGFSDTFSKRRKFSVDMAGFAVSIPFLLTKPNATMQYIIGYQEDRFLRSLGIQIKDLEPKADNCTKVLVWHTKTIFKNYPPMADLQKINGSHPNDSIQVLYKDLFNNT